MSAPGTRPAGVEGDQEISRWVRRMFDGVAPRYDLLNHVLSFNADRYWRWRTVRKLRPILEKPGARVVDLCCGSGDLLIALQGRTPATVLGSDFSHQMLRACDAKIAAGRLPAEVFESDAMQLPLAAGSLDLVTCAFGFRNLVNYRAGLAEMLRVLKPGGTVAILEFSTPPNALFRRFYEFYSLRVLPRIAGMISGVPEAYEYLPESVRKFPGAPELAEAMQGVGFGDVEYTRMTFGIVALHVGRKRR
ncbi:MAG: bifunctional demethylmenaquinone methyltransferase/2-methoxy-6-polyprenyl-1,4-benzoquinol methylase UbiE [Acidobacteria bacterium]|nr:bifunctional demethylmenaquinone methyltransferase/2-methoxy-6-polyprenyl-1,4-benzoquinol methylase UbiE [Acidobacteriota bacterium]